MGQVSPITHARHQARQTSVSQKENAKRNCLYKARYAVCITDKDDPFESEFLSVLLLVYISSSQSDPNMTYPICNKTENKVMQKALRTLLLFFWKKISCFYILKRLSVVILTGYLTCTLLDVNNSGDCLKTNIPLKTGTFFVSLN